MSQLLTVSEVARRAGLTASHVRYYERAGLLPAPIRSGRQVRWDEAVVARLETIAAARDAGLTLSEIRELSELAERLAVDADAVRSARR
jgi:MerR family transcriptional regulator, redox-sensitive transcriptional activator SoxR